MLSLKEISLCRSALKCIASIYQQVALPTRWVLIFYTQFEREKISSGEFHFISTRSTRAVSTGSQEIISERKSFNWCSAHRGSTGWILLLYFSAGSSPKPWPKPFKLRSGASSAIIKRKRFYCKFKAQKTYMQISEFAKKNQNVKFKFSSYAFFANLFKLRVIKMLMTNANFINIQIA